MKETYLQFTCTLCKYKEYVKVDGPEPYLVDSNWPIGWLRITSQAIGLDTPLFDTYCNACKAPILKIMGYKDYKTYVSVVKAQADIDQKLDSEESPSSENKNELDVPFYLFDDGDN